MNINGAIRGRASTRAFLDRPVPRDVIHLILDASRWAPSGVNTQPWQVAAATGGAKRPTTQGHAGGRGAGHTTDPHFQY